MTEARRKSDSGFVGSLDATIFPTSIISITDPAEKRHISLLNHIISNTHELAAAKAEIMRLSNLVYFDKLTGLGNQRLLEKSFDDAAEKGEKIVLVFIDLNKFKHINDTYGHDIGDEALKLASRTLASLTRSTDVIAHIHEKGEERADHLPIRYAGDEFIILFKGATLDELQNKIAQVKAAFSDLKLKYGDIDIPVGASIGAYEYKQGDTLEHCKKQADIAMYEDKKTKKPTSMRFDRFSSGYIMPESSYVPQVTFNWTNRQPQ